MQRPGEGEHHAVGHLVGRDRREAVVHRIRLLLVALEADEGELGLDEARIDGRDPDRAPEQVLPQRVGEAAHGELRGDVRGAAGICLAAGDRAHEEDVPLVADVREHEPRHPHHAVDVRVHHPLLVVGGRLGERCPPEREPGVVEEDVDPAELGDRRLDERGRVGLVGDVDLERDVGLDPLDPSRAAGDADPGLAQLAHRRSADPGGGAGDDRRLAVQVHVHGPKGRGFSLYPRVSPDDPGRG